MFGARLTYPSDLFRALQRPAGSIDYRFASRDGKVVLAFASWSNTGGNSLPQFKSEALSKSRHTDLTYQPGGRNWFVVSGYNGDTIYYEKVMITCQGKTISAFGMRYPIAQRDRYDHVVERIEDTFVPGRNCHKQETQRRVAE